MRKELEHELFFHLGELMQEYEQTPFADIEKETIFRKINSVHLLLGNITIEEMKIEELKFINEKNEVLYNEKL